MKTQSTKTVHDILESFSRNIRNLEHLLGGILPKALEADANVRSVKNLTYKELVFEILWKPNQIVRNGEKKYKWPNKEQFDKLSEAVFSLRTPPDKDAETLIEGVFLLINSYFEYLLHDLLSYYYEKYPYILESEKVKITIGDLRKFNTIDDAMKTYLAERSAAILSFMQFDDYKKQLLKAKIDLQDKIINWVALKEVRERRNVIVHRKSRVDKKYIDASMNIFNLKIGEKAIISSEYLFYAIQEIQTAGDLLCLNCWEKWDTENQITPIEMFNRICYWSVVDKKYDYVIRIYPYSKRLAAKNQKEANYLMEANFDYLFSLKRLNNLSRLKKELLIYKSRNLSTRYRMLYHIITGNLSSAIKLFAAVKKANQLTLNGYNTWPIFEDIRNDARLHQRALKLLSK
jgi:hypothetical protein